MLPDDHAEPTTPAPTNPLMSLPIGDVRPILDVLYKGKGRRMPLVYIQSEDGVKWGRVVHNDRGLSYPLADLDMIPLNVQLADARREAVAAARRVVALERMV